MQGGSDPSRRGACPVPWSDSEVASSVAQQGHSEGTQGPEAPLRVMPSTAEQGYEAICTLAGL